MRAFAFGLGQSTANAWRPLLREGVQKAVAPGGSVPARAPTPRATVLEAEAAATSGRDGPERPRHRPRDPETQTPSYSGKKKRPRSKSAFWVDARRAKATMCANRRQATVMSKSWWMKPPPRARGYRGIERDRLARGCTGRGADIAPSAAAHRARTDTRPARAQPAHLQHPDWHGA